MFRFTTPQKKRYGAGESRKGFTSGAVQAHEKAAAVAASSGSKNRTGSVHLVDLLYRNAHKSSPKVLRDGSLPVAHAWFTRQRGGFTSGVRQHTTNSAAGGQLFRKQTHPVPARAGFTLIETFVAITILLLAIVGPMTIAARGLQTAFFAKEQVTAYYLAQEGVEFVRAARDENALHDRGNWLAGMTMCSSTNGCGIRIRTIDTDGIKPNGANSGFFSCGGSANACRVYHDTDDDLDAKRGFYVQGNSSYEETPFTRQVWVRQVVPNKEAEVTVTISWPTTLFSGTRTLTVQSRIFNMYD